MLAAIFGIGKRTIFLLKRTLNFTGGSVYGIIEVLGFFYIKSLNKKTKKEGTRRSLPCTPETMSAANRLHRLSGYNP